MNEAEIISPWTVYWVTRLDSIQLALAFLAGITASVGTVYAYCNFLDLRRRPRKVWAIVALFVFLTVGAMLTPSTKEACAIYLIPKIANSESVQEIGGDIETLAKEWLEELRPKKAKLAEEPEP